MTALLPLRARHCLIIGASGGIGAAIARRFAAEGALVTLAGRNEPKLRRVLSGLDPFTASRLSPVADPKKPEQAEQAGHTDTQLQHSYAVLDLSPDRTQSQSPSQSQPQDPDSFYSTHHAVLDDIYSRTGQIDVLVNAAGIAQWQLLHRTSLADARNVLDTNVMGAIMASRYVARHMKRRRANRDACIINVASLLAQKGVAGASVYAASKAGLLGLTHSLAAELAPFRIRTNVIVPGYIETELIANMSREPLEEKIPLGRLGTPEEVADAAAFLAQNPYANNCVLNLDGGLGAV